MALDVDELRVRGTWLKHARPSRGPLPYRNPAPDNRWQRGAFVDAVYPGDAQDTVWAEWYRHLAEAGMPPAERLPVELWKWKVDVMVADLSDEARLERVNLPPPRPGRASWPRYQAVGEELWKEGWAGLVAPSAARPVDEAPVPPTGMTT